MAGPVQAAGAQTDPTKYGALNMAGEQFTGIWTQRAPYRDAATAYLVKKFYQGSRFDSIWDGLNREIGAKLTDVRRPGSPVWNANTFNPVYSWYSFKFIQNGVTVLRVLQDTKTGGTNGTGQVIDVTAGGATVIWNKSAGAGRTRFLGVGSILYMANGVDNIKWIRSGTTWAALTSFTAGQFIVDSNNNLQLNIGSQTVTITNIQIQSDLVTMFFESLTPISIPDGAEITFPFTFDTITIVTNPANTDTITINGTVVTFIPHGNTPIGNQVPLGLTIAATATALQAFLSASADVNLVKSTYTNPSAGVVVATSVVAGFTVTVATSVPAKISQVPSISLTTVPALNGTTQIITAVENSQQVQFSFTHGNVAFSVETGTATTGAGITGATQPAWATAMGAITQDGSAQWECRGPSVQQWMYGAPISAPTVTQAPAPSIYPQWAANTWYAPFFAILVAGVLYQLTTQGTTGASVPSFNPTAGATTADGGCVWTSLGTDAWAATTTYATGSAVQATFSFYITILVPQWVPPYNGAPGYYKYVSQQQLVNATAIFQCTTGGISGTTAPAWANGLGTTVQDNTVSWVNLGNVMGWPGATQALNLSTKVLDVNNNVQTIQNMGESGATAPAWATGTGSFTNEAVGGNPITWLNGGPYSKANTGAWIYAYSGFNSVTGDVTTASPLSSPITVTADNLAVIQGAGVQTTFDQIKIWRTTEGDQTLLLLDQIPNPGPNSSWIYTDTTPDTGLNAEEEAPVADSNNPPPVPATAPVYYLQRVWIISGGNVQYSGGPDTLVGNGSSAFPPDNFLTPPSQPLKLRPINVQDGALLVYTTSGIQIILGAGTPSNPFFMAPFCDKINLASYDAEDMLGTQLYLMESNMKVSTLQIQYPFNPQSGYSEIGFPIGDQFTQVTTGGISSALYNSANACLSWNINKSGDTGMYVADGAVGWFRMSTVNTPESGLLWSPRAAIVGGTSAVQSVETSPGVFQLLIGPATLGPILYRDTTGTVFTDAGNPYDAYDVKGVILLCSTGQWTEVAHISTKSAAVGARPMISTLMGEIATTTTRPWNALTRRLKDPVNTPDSKSVYSDRFETAINGKNQTGDCIMVKFDYGTQAVADELMDWGIFATTEEERKEQAAAAK